MIIGTPEGIIYTQIKDCYQQLSSIDAKKDSTKTLTLKDQINIKISESSVYQITLSNDQLTVFVCLENNKILLFDIREIVDKVIIYY